MSGLLDQVFDKPMHLDGKPRGLIICSTPRSGSHQLGSLLNAAGVGVPTEYFHPAGVSVFSRRWGLQANNAAYLVDDAYLDAVLFKRTASGIFASIAFPQHIPDLLRMLPRLRDVFFIHLKRGNTAEQIVSLITLYQTKTPFDDAATFDFIPDASTASPKLIATLDRYIKHQHQQWASFLRDRPHVDIWSEDLFENPLAVIKTALQDAQIAVDVDDLSRAVAAQHRSNSYAVHADIKSRLRLEFEQSLRLVTSLRR